MTRAWCWFLLCAACAPELLPSMAPMAPPPARPKAAWGEVVSARVHAERSRPQPVGGDWRIWSPSQRLRLWLDADGATIDPYGDAWPGVQLRLRSWTRDGERLALEPQAPMLGACDGTGREDVLGACLRRVERDLGGVVEWWQGVEEGLEQGFDVVQPGKEELVLEVAVDGATVTGEGLEIDLQLPSGPPWRYGGLFAEDAEGRALPARLDAEGDRIRIVVDVREARGAVRVDPLLFPDPAWVTSFAVDPSTTIEGALAGVGDVNRDGLADVILGLPVFDGAFEAEGKAWLYLGSPEGLETTPVWAAEPADEAHAQFGRTAAPAGDVNGDGLADVIIGAPYYGARAEGRVWLFAGTTQGGLSPTAVWVQTPSAEGDTYAGLAVASAGDVNRDGYDDVLVGGPGHLEDSLGGSAWLYLGGPGGLATSPVWQGYSSSEESRFGDSVASAGDMDADGYDDIIIGGEGYGEAYPGAGAVWVYRGGPQGPSTVPTWAWFSPNRDQEHAGSVVASAGDIDGDGDDEILVAAPDAEEASGLPAGRVDLWLGSDQGLASTPDWSSSGVGNSRLGVSLAAAGDVNADGFGDVVIGAERGDEVSLWLGGPQGLSATPAWAVDVAVRNGVSVAAAGDVNGDGLDDILVRAVAFEDAVYQLFLGCVPSPEIVGNPIDEDCDGGFVCFADGDGDGFGDVNAWTVVSPDASCSDPGESPTELPPGDCDDDDSTRSPGLEDVPGNDEDEDCDGYLLCFVDADNDGETPYPAQTINTSGGNCYAAGVADRASSMPDCDDNNSRVGPYMSELPGNEVDENCDSRVFCYTDEDGDGYSIALGGLSADADCRDPGEAVAPRATPDCDDSDIIVHPDATELAGNELDEDCDQQLLCWADADGDGYTTSPPQTVVSPQGGCGDAGEALTLSTEADCDDQAAATHPGAAEVTGDTLDEDCDGDEACFADVDGDGSRSETQVVLSADLDCLDAGEAAAEVAVDCDDGDEARSPTYAEAPANEVDEDCDGLVGCLEDDDGDGYVLPGADLIEAASCPPGTVLLPLPGPDCNEGASGVHPGADDVPGNGIDEDCSGADGVEGGDTDVPGGGGGGGGGSETKGEAGCACGHASPLSGLPLLLLLGARRRRLGA